MNREILFRGKRIDTGEWIYGHFTNKKIGSLIVPVIEVCREADSGDYIESHEIDGETLGQYIGIYDNKMEIQFHIKTVRGSGKVSFAKINGRKTTLKAANLELLKFPGRTPDKVNAEEYFTILIYNLQ